MLVAVLCIVLQVVLLVYVNVRACNAIASCKHAVPSIKKIGVYLVWFLPVVGILIIANRFIPKFYTVLSQVDGAAINGSISGGGGDCG